MTEPRSDYGIVEREADADETSRHAERIRVVGYTVLHGRWTPAELTDLGDRLDRVLAAQSAEFGGTERMAAIGETFTARCPLLYDDVFLRLVSFPPLLALCRALLGHYIVLMQQNGVINPPGQSHTQAAYHRDLPYQHFVSSRPLAVSALFCIDPFRRETGATTVLPGSHRIEAFPSPSVAETLDTSIEADAGSFIVFDSMLFHRSGTNTSTGPRRAVNQVFSVPIIAQQIALPAALGGRYANDPELSPVLGYDSAPAGSVMAWRERRLRRVNR